MVVCGVVSVTGAVVWLEEAVAETALSTLPMFSRAQPQDVPVIAAINAAADRDLVIIFAFTVSLLSFC